MDSLKELVDKYIDSTEQEHIIANDEKYKKLKQQAVEIRDQINVCIKDFDNRKQLCSLIDDLASVYLCTSSFCRYLDFRTAFLAGITIGLEAKQNDKQLIKNLRRCLGENENE